MYKKLCVYSDDAESFKIPRVEITTKTVVLYMNKNGGYYNDFEISTDNPDIFKSTNKSKKCKNCKNHSLTVSN